MNNDDDPVGKALGIPPIPPKKNAVEILLADAHNDSASIDFENARANIYTMLETAQLAITELASVAKSSQEPRAYEVLAKLIETSTKANRDLLELQTKIRTITIADEPQNKAAKSVTNNLFVGSTSEFQDMINELKKK